MAALKIEDVASSKARLTIASLISIRPRTLSELAETTGISIQGVLKHLGKLRAAGFLTQRELTKNKYLRYRKVYSALNRRVGDFSDGDLMIVHLTRPIVEEEPKFSDAYEELESVAEDVILLRSRVRDLERRMGRLIRDLASSQERLRRTIISLKLDAEEAQIASIIFTEYSAEDAKRILSKHYGCEDPNRTIKEIVKTIRGA